jgi:hypothetical protein
MKYWNSGLNAPGTRTFIATVHIAAAVIGWRRSGKERTGQTQFSTKFAAKPSFMPHWRPVDLFIFLFFEISSPMWPNRGLRCRLFLTLRIFWYANFYCPKFNINRQACADVGCTHRTDGLFCSLPTYLLGFFWKYECWVTNLIMFLYHYFFGIVFGLFVSQGFISLWNV